MDTYDVIKARRSIRKFTQKPLPQEALNRMLNAARLAPTGSNLQPLRFAATLSPRVCAEIFPHTKWAGYFKDGSGWPKAGEEPTGYIALLTDNAVRKDADLDVGAAGMSIMLQAQSEGIASCWLGAINRQAIAAVLGIDTERYTFNSIIALGYPAMESVPVDIDANDDVKYYLDKNGVFCVPKHKIDDIARIVE